jgi:hypothetical protein
VLVNEKPVSGSYLIAAGDQLEAVHLSGEKGGTQWTCESRSLATRSCVVKTV